MEICPRLDGSQWYHECLFLQVRQLHPPPSISFSCVRINLSVALVAMVGVDHRNQSHSETGVCPERRSGDEQVAGREGEFDWSKSEQGLVMGSYYWSYTAAQVETVQ